METDDAKLAWQDQPARPRLTADDGTLVEEIRKKQQAFDATIFWRDFREVGICVVMIPVWFFMGIASGLPWTWYLMVPALLWIATFILVDRLRNRGRSPDPSGPLLQYVESSLAKVEHQIWMLRNVFWWYLLPIGLAMLAYIGQDCWQFRGLAWLQAIFAMALFASIGAVALGFVYWLNQLAVRTSLEPRRRELEALRASLADEGPTAS